MASAQIVWNGAGSDNNWSTGANWVGGVAPSNPSGVVVEFGGTTRLTPDLNTSWTVAGVSFNSTAGAFTLDGAPSAKLTIGASGVVNSSASAQLVKSDIILSAAQTWNAASGNLSFTGKVDTSGHHLTLTSAAGRLISISGTANITGSGNVTITGPGTVLMDGNSFTGTTTINGGTVQLGDNKPFGTGAIVLNSGTLQPTKTVSISNNITLGGDITISGASNFTFSGTWSLGALPRLLTITNTASTRLTGVLSGTGGFTKAGSGSLALDGVNTFTGNLTILAGSVTVGTGGSMAASTAGLIVDGGALTFNNAAQTIGSLSGTGGTITFGTGNTLTLQQTTASSYSGVLAGVGGLVLNGADGVFTLSGSSANTATGNTTVAAGTLILAKSGGAVAIAGGTITVGDGSGTDVLRLGASNQIGASAVLRLSGGTFQLNNFSQTFGTALTMTTSSIIDFGSTSGSVAFASSSASAWTGTLTILNYTTGVNTLRFGTDSTGLTSTQLASIAFSGYTAGGQIDSLGYVSPVPEPATYALGAGLAGLGIALVSRQRRRSGRMSPPR